MNFQCISHLAVTDVNCLLHPRKAGILWIIQGHRRRPQKFSFVQPTSHVSFGISFKMWLAMTEIWIPYSFGSPGLGIF